MSTYIIENFQEVETQYDSKENLQRYLSQNKNKKLLSRVASNSYIVINHTKLKRTKSNLT